LNREFLFQFFGALHPTTGSHVADHPLAILLSGVVAFRFLPVAHCRKLIFRLFSVGAGLPAQVRKPWLLPSRRRWSASSGVFAGVTQMTSSSGLGNTGITLQFDLNRDITPPRATSKLPSTRSQPASADLPGQPTYRKVNPADAPIMLLVLTSDNIPPAEIYDAADSILAQKLAQVEGVGQVFTWGSARPAVRVEVESQSTQ